MLNKEELLSLRADIVGKTRELALNSDASPAEKLNVLMDMMQSGDVSVDFIREAYKQAQALEGDSDKLDAMLDLIYIIDNNLPEEKVDDQPTQDGDSQTASSSDSQA